MRDRLDNGDLMDPGRLRTGKLHTFAFAPSFGCHTVFYDSHKWRQHLSKF